METGDIILIGGIGFLAYMFLKPKTGATSIVAPALTPAQIQAQQAAQVANQLVPGTTVTQGQLNAAGGGVANIIKAFTGGGSSTPAPVATPPAYSTTPWTYTPPVDDPIYTPISNPLSTDPDYTDPVTTWTLPPADTTLDPIDTSFESDDDGFSGVPVMDVIRDFARSPVVTSRGISSRVGCPGTDQLIGMLTNF